MYLLIDLYYIFTPVILRYLLHIIMCFTSLHFIEAERYLNPVSVFIFNAKIYSLCQNSNISKKCFPNSVLILNRPLIFIVAIMSQILNNVECEQ